MDMVSESRATFDRLSPLTGEVISRGRAGTVEDALRAADAAQAAFPAWAALGPSARRALLLKAADLLEQRADSFIAIMSEEVGSGTPWATFDVFHGAGTMREAAALTTQVTGEVIPSDRPGSIALAIRQPAGVVLGFAPWNAPIILGVRSIATPLACGNTVVMKASEMCPRTHELLGEVMRDAGFPDGVVNIINNAPADAPAIVSALIAHKAVRRINFTGSTRTGKIIARLAAEQLKPVLLELGGKSPLLVLDDADLDQAAAAASFGAYINSGQVCMATERIIVDEKVADEFVAKFTAKLAVLKAADPRGGPVALGSVVDAAAASAVERVIADALSKGGELYQPHAPSGTLLSASVIDRVTPEMVIYQEECFGPVTSIVRVSGEGEAIRVANDTEYGLASAVFTRDTARGLRVASQIDAGICHINGPTVHDEAQLPFGGTKASGYGRFGGKAGIAEFTELRQITIGTLPYQYPI